MGGGMCAGYSPEDPKPPEGRSREHYQEAIKRNPLGYETAA